MEQPSVFPIVGKGFYQSMLKLAIPIAMQNLFVSCLSLVDTAMVTSLGNINVAAIGVAVRWVFLLNLFLFGLCSGCSALVSQYWGAKDYNSIHITLGFSLLNACCIALLFTLGMCLFPTQLLHVFTDEESVIDAAVPYLRLVSISAFFSAIVTILSSVLRATENVWLPFATGAITVLINTSLNYIFIYGKLGVPAMELSGAAIATTISMVIHLIILLSLTYRKKRFIISPIKDLFNFNKEFVAKYYRIVSPVVGNEVMWAIGTNIYSMVLARQGSENYAAFTVFSAIEQLAFVFFIGLCYACAIMVGKAVGSGDHEAGWQLSKRFLRLVPSVAVVCGMGLILSRKFLVGLLPLETVYAAEVAANLLLIYGGWMIIRMVSYVCIVGIFRAGGDTRTGVFLDIGTVYFIGIPVVYLLGMKFHVRFEFIILGMYMAEDIVKSILCLVYFRTRRWIQQLTV